MAEKSFDDLDELMAQVRLCVAKLRQSDAETAEELKGLLRQLEDWVESLVVDSLRLRSLESAKSAQGAAKRTSKARDKG